MRRSAVAVPRPVVHRTDLTARCCAARAPAVEECTDAPTSSAGCPGGRQPGEATRGAGERSLSRQTERRKKVVVRARRTLAGVHGPRVAARRCQRDQLETRKVEELRLVMPRHPRVHANLHYSGWNEVLVCGGDTACGRRPRCFPSGSCWDVATKRFPFCFQYTFCIHARASWLSWRTQALAPPCQPGGEQPQRPPTWRSRPIPKSREKTLYTG